MELSTAFYQALKKGDKSKYQRTVIQNFSWNTKCMYSNLKRILFTFNTFSVKHLPVKNYNISLDIKIEGLWKITAEVIYAQSTAYRSAFRGKNYEPLEITCKIL